METILATAIILVALPFGIIALVSSFRNLQIGLQAEKKLRQEILYETKRNTELSKLEKRLSKSHVDKDVFAKALGEIEVLLERLNAVERQKIRQGLNQPTKKGQEAFIKKLFARDNSGGKPINQKNDDPLARSSHSEKEKEEDIKDGTETYPVH